MKTTKGMRVATVWKLCLEMWDWIEEQIRNGTELTIQQLKYAWTSKHGYKLSHDCFFCDYDENYTKTCSACPARTIVPGFHCRRFGMCDWKENPRGFHAMLHDMNNKRLKMNREKRSK